MHQDARDQVTQVMGLLEAHLGGFDEILAWTWEQEIQQAGWEGVMVDPPARLGVRATYLTSMAPGFSPGQVVDALARELVARALQKSGWNPRARAPQCLGLVFGDWDAGYEVYPARGHVLLSGRLGYRVL